MTSGNSREGYLRAARERPSLGISEGKRPEPTLDEARSELAQALSRIGNSLLKDKYGPFVGVISEPAINEVLKGLEANVARVKGDVTILAEEILDRALPPKSKQRR